MNQNELFESWKHEEGRPFTRWDFSHLDGRMLEEQHPWSYSLRASEIMRQSSVIDLGIRYWCLFRQWYLFGWTPTKLPDWYQFQPITAGVIERKKISFNGWGDTVNTASRMQSHSLPGQVQISQVTYELIKNDFVCKPRGKIQVKGKGEMDVWLVVSAKEQ